VDSAALEMTGQLKSDLVANDQQAAIDKPLRFSVLKQMGRSPLHCLHAQRTDFEPTLAMKIGSAAHVLLLGGQRIAVFTGKARRGKEWEEFKAANADALLLNAKEMDIGQRIADSVRADPVASRVLFADGTVYEQTIHWTWMGRKFRSTPDARTKTHLVELKTTRDASLERFKWDALRSAYHAQLWTQATAMEFENGYAPKSIYIIAVESRAPYPVSVHELTPRALEAGGRLCRAWMEKFNECTASGSWPGYSSAVVELDVPLDVETDLIFDDDNDSTESE
jgi:hypothetical protein